MEIVVDEETEARLDALDAQIFAILARLSELDPETGLAILGDLRAFVEEKRRMNESDAVIGILRLRADSLEELLDRDGEL